MTVPIPRSTHQSVAMSLARGPCGSTAEGESEHAAQAMAPATIMSAVRRREGRERIRGVGELGRHRNRMAAPYGSLGGLMVRRAARPVSSARQYRDTIHLLQARLNTSAQPAGRAGPMW